MLRILVIDDDDPAIILFKYYLRKLGEIDIAVDSERAIHLTNKYTYDLILMDINLKEGLDGLALTRYLRNIKNLKDVPIIVVTAYGEFYRDESLAAGCNYFLSKPFEKAELMRIVYLALDNRSL